MKSFGIHQKKKHQVVDKNPNHVRTQHKDRKKNFEINVNAM